MESNLTNTDEFISQVLAKLASLVVCPEKFSIEFNWNVIVVIFFFGIIIKLRRRDVH